MRLVYIALIGLVCAFLTTLVWNAQSCQSPQDQPISATDFINFDQEQLAQQLANAIKITTVSHDQAAPDQQAFSAFHEFLQHQFPLVHQQLQRHHINRHSLLYHWPASAAPDNPEARQKAVLLMAHMDVVPAKPDDWQHPPFAGVIDATSVWGRGTLDDKGSMIALLHAIEELLREGFQPSHDIYLAFGHDEETGGLQGAAKIADYFKNRGLRFAAILDEGGIIAKGFIPGLKADLAAIGPAEKGYLSVELIATGESGHSSMPGSQSAINRLNQALMRIQTNPFPANYAMIKNMMRTIAGSLPFGQRLFLCNDWAFKDIIVSQLEKSPALNASMRTTMAITRMSAGFKENVIPSRAEALVNLRLLPGDSVDAAVSHLHKIINDEHIQIRVLPGAKTASKVTDVTGKAYQWLANSLRQSKAGEALVIAPRVVTAATDSSHFVALSDNILRFTPFTITPETLKGIHGANEHVNKQDLAGATRFYYYLLKNSNTML